tara:strand:+ start:362 stop:1057 length:696 start_codon:yes stop_codon:yes gene_type:complete
MIYDLWGDIFVIFAFMNVNKQLPPSIMEMLSRSQPSDPPKSNPAFYGSFPSDGEQGDLPPEAPLFDVEGLRRGVSQVESAGGVLMMNPYSSATGEFGQLYNEIKDLPFMNGIDRKTFSEDRELQSKVFRMRVEGDLPNIPSLRGNATDLTEEYAPQLGDDWDYSLDEVAAISNYIGRQGSRNYFSSIRDGREYKPSGVNKSVEEYLELYRQGRDEGTEEFQDPIMPSNFKH